MCRLFYFNSVGLTNKNDRNDITPWLIQVHTQYEAQQVRKAEQTNKQNELLSKDLWSRVDNKSSLCVIF